METTSSLPQMNDSINCDMSVMLHYIYAYIQQNFSALKMASEWHSTLVSARP